MKVALKKLFRMPGKDSHYQKVQMMFIQTQLQKAMKMMRLREGSVNLSTKEASKERIAQETITKKHSQTQE